MPTNVVPTGCPLAAERLNRRASSYLFLNITIREVKIKVSAAKTDDELGSACSVGEKQEHPAA
jgi:hypothetical protein